MHKLLGAISFSLAAVMALAVPTAAQAAPVEQSAATVAKHDRVVIQSPVGVRHYGYYRHGYYGHAYYHRGRRVFVRSPVGFQRGYRHPAVIVRP
jgi:hypothetical protein